MTVRELAVVRDLVARARLERENDRERSDKEVVVRFPLLRSTSARYATDEQRIAARRRTYRESKQRHGHVYVSRACPSCGGRMAAHSSVRLCRKCWLAEVEPEHGTISRYSSRRDACRCGLCRAAWSEYHRARRAQLQVAA